MNLTTALILSAAFGCALLSSKYDNRRVGRTLFVISISLIGVAYLVGMFSK